MKTNIKELSILWALLIITIIGALIYKNIENQKIYELQKNKLLETIEKQKLTKEEQILIEVNKTKKETEIKINKIQKEINKLNLEKNKNEEYKKCLIEQIIRIWEWKRVEEWFCKNKILKKQAETIKKSTEKVQKIKNDTLQVNKNIKVLKSNLFICLEVKNTFWFKSDEYRCATMMSLVGFAETENWKTWIWPKYNNWYWIKKPTDQKWLVWNWKVWAWRHIIFETAEMWSYAFAYYYMKYHDTRDFNNFVDRWVSWNNVKYKNFLINNYNKTYIEYKKILK